MLRCVMRNAITDIVFETPPNSIVIKFLIDGFTLFFINLFKSGSDD